MSVGGAISASESGARGRHFNAGKLATEHDAAGLLCPVGQQKPVPNMEISALWIAGRVMVFGQEQLFRPATGRPQL